MVVVGNDVYVAGYECNGNCNGQADAKYWKNGTATNLSGGTFSQTNDIAVSGNDVYVLGFNGSACGYWKNGTFVNLIGCINAESIVIVGSDVYVAGRNCR